jgi:DNA-binding transcriptional MerR regulator
MVVEGSPVYQPHEFAELAGVTVRALHYYDRLGLLKPRRTNSDYRLYRAEDLECLEQIVALKFVGFPLKQIKFLLDRDKSGLLEALRMQRRVLEKKRRLLDSAISAIQTNACAVSHAGSSPRAASTSRKRSDHSFSTRACSSGDHNCFRSSTLALASSSNPNRFAFRAPR